MAKKQEGQEEEISKNQKSPKCPSYGEDKTGFLKVKSQQFANLIQASYELLGLTMEQVAEMSGVDRKRMAVLVRGEEIFSRSEIQLLSVMLGIGLDKLFPLNIKDSDIHSVYEKLSKHGVGIIAPLAEPEKQNEASQLEFERAVVQLNYCAKCLNEFPP